MKQHLHSASKVVLVVSSPAVTCSKRATCDNANEQSIQFASNGRPFNRATERPGDRDRCPGALLHHENDLLCFSTIQRHHALIRAAIPFAYRNAFQFTRDRAAAEHILSIPSASSHRREAIGFPTELPRTTGRSVLIFT